MSITINPTAITKIKELMADHPVPGARVQALRFAVQGGGCSGFSYAMQWENEKGPMDKEFEFDGLKVIVDATSLMYLDGVTVDYLETLESSGFKFDNPNVKSTCGCGQSFSA
jgi:iron-sulfur cluster assembly accessory protein